MQPSYNDAIKYVSNHAAILRTRYDFGTPHNRKIMAIKELRTTLPGLSLMDGKNAIEYYFGFDGMREPPETELTTLRIEDRVLIENFLDRMRGHMTDRELAAFNRFIARDS